MKTAVYHIIFKVFCALLTSVPLLSSNLEQAFEPISAPVRFYGIFNGTNVGTVSLNGVNSSETNVLADYVCGDGAWFGTPEAVAMLDIYKTYTLTLSASYAYHMETHLSEPRLHDLLLGRNKNSQQYNRYRLYIRKVDPGVSTNDWELACSAVPPGWNTEIDADGDCHPVTVIFEVQLRPDPGARPVQQPGVYNGDGSDQVDDAWERDEDAIGATTAPGDEDILTLSAGKGASSSTMGIQWGVNLGRLWDGRSAGKIRVIEDRIRASILTPSVLLYTPRSADTNELEVLTAGSPPAIRQIKAPQAFVDVTTPSTNSFQMNFYTRALMGGKDGSGFYTLVTGATSFVSYRIDSGGALSNRLAIHEIRNGQTNSSVLDYSVSSNLWTLTRGTGADSKVITRHVSFQSNFVNRVEVEEIKNGAGAISDRTAEVWKTEGFTRELVRITNGLGSANLVTYFNYNTISNVNYLTRVEYPDGYWERREYSTYTNEDWYPYGSLIRTVKPWKDSTIESLDNDCHVTVYTYPPSGGSGSFKMQSWHDPEFYEDPFSGDPDPYSVFLAKHGAATYEEETWFDPDWCGSQPAIIEEIRQFGDLEHYGEAVSTKTYSGFSGRLNGHLFSRANNSGKLDAYDYQFGTWNATNFTFSTTGSTNDVRQIIYHGTFADVSGNLATGESGFGIEPVKIHPFKSTKQVKIIVGGNLVAKELYLLQSVSTSGTLLERIVYQRDALGRATNVIRYDGSTGEARTIYQADWQGTNAWPGALKLSETDETGVTRAFSYDSLKRLKSETKTGSTLSGYPSQAAVVSTLHYDASGRILTNMITSGILTNLFKSVYDLAGRLTSHTPPDQLTISYSYVDGGRQTNITYSSGLTRILRAYRDRRPASVTGTSAPNQFFEYFLTGLHITDHMHPKNITQTTYGTTNSTRWTRVMTDNRYALAWAEAPGFRSEYTKNKEYRRQDLGTEISLIAESGVNENTLDIVTEFERDYFGIVQNETTWGGSISWGGLDSTDRIKTHDWYYEQDSSNHWFKVNETWTYPIDNSAWKTLISRTKDRITGLATNTISEVLLFDANTNQTTIRVSVDRANKKVTTTTTVPESNISAIEVAVNGLLQTETSTTVNAATWHYYDAFGREIGTKDPLGFVSGSLYNNLGQVIATTNKSGQVTTFSYYPAGGTNAGLLYCETGPTGKRKYYNYNGFGQVTHIWGEVPYPEKRDYNFFGDLVTLTTYRGGSGWNSTNWAGITPGTNDVTTWYYDEPTGLLTNKTDAAGRSVNYDYYFSHIPKSTINARGQGNLRLYSINGDLQEIIYTNAWGNSSVVYTNYNRFASPRTIFDDAGELNITYDHSGRVIREAYTNGLLSGVVISNRFDPVRGKNRVQLQTPSGTVTTDYAYDTRGRISGLTNGNSSVTYTYLSNSDLLQTTTSRSNTTTVLTTTRTWENGYRLKSIKNVAGGATVSSHDYIYDALDRRRVARREDLSTWQYDYNDRDELVRGSHFWADGTPVAGQQFEYNYDNIGNRIETREGGDEEGNNLRVEGYGANNLNQITVRTNSGSTDIIGAAYADATVTVNGGSTTRQGEYFHRALPGGSTSTPTWQSVTTLASADGNTETNTGNLLLPPNTQSFTYDYDGNLTSDGVWSYTWDQQNRLISMTSLLTSSAPNSARKKLDFAYDYSGRRIGKIVSSWNGSSYAPSATNKYCYDELHLIAELTGTKSLQRSYSWGLDLSETLEWAGGVGGLAILSNHAPSPANYYPAYDANGNVIVLVDHAGNDAAEYEYSTSAETIQASGTFASQNPFRWSTKFHDDETALVYYGVRYLHPSTGKWLQRDPIQEGDGPNLYAFVQNAPIDFFDPLGTTTASDQAAATGTGLATFANNAYQAYSIYQDVRDAVELFNAIQEISAVILDSMEDDENFDEVFAELMGIAQDSLTDLVKSARNTGGETIHTRLGRAMHKAWNYGPGWKKEFLLDSGKRVDAAHPKLKKIKELKPNNKRAIARGLKQLAAYIKELNRTKGKGWKGDIETY